MAKPAIRREPFNTTKFRWPKRLLWQLGKMTDKALAALAGVHFLTVTKELRPSDLVRPEWCGPLAAYG